LNDLHKNSLYRPRWRGGGGGETSILQCSTLMI
jgi:hypothetical protein